MILFSDRGTPDGYYMHGYSGHTLKFVSADGSFHYVQVHLKREGGAKTLDNDTAVGIGGTNPDYATEQLFTEIENGKFPTWNVFVVCVAIIRIRFFLKADNDT